jgi:hypothetical protein
MSDERKSFLKRAVEKNQAEVEAELAKAREAMLSTMVKAAGLTTREVEAMMDIVISAGKSVTREMERVTENSRKFGDRSDKAMKNIEQRLDRLTSDSHWANIEKRMDNVVTRWSKPHWALAVGTMFLVGVIGVQIGTWTSLKWVEAEVAQANMSFDSVITKETAFRRDKQGRLLIKFGATPKELIEKGWTYVQEPKAKGRR